MREATKTMRMPGFNVLSFTSEPAVLVENGDCWFALSVLA